MSSEQRRWFSDPLPFGKLVDCGIRGYREFACSWETFEWLRDGAMTHVDGKPVRLTVAEVAVGGNNVFVTAYETGAVGQLPKGAEYTWQKNREAA